MEAILKSIDKNPSRKTITRDPSIELLRILLMFYVMAYHFFSFYIQITFEGDKPLFLTKLFWSTVIANGYVSVVCYVFISGYFGMRFRLKQLTSLVVQVLFCSYLCLTLLLFIRPDLISDGNSILQYILPISSSVWWFMTIYILLYIIAPFLNSGVEKLSKRQFQLLLCILLYLDCFSNYVYTDKVGGQLLNFIFIYLLARYIRKYNINLKRPVLLYLMAVFTIFIVNYVTSLYLNRPFLSATIYNSVLVILASVSLFFSFKNIKIHNTSCVSWILKISPLCLGVYLFHFNYFSWNILIHPILFKIEQLADHNLSFYVLFILCFCFVAFIFCLFLEKTRQIICQPLLNFIEKKIDKFSLNI